MSLTVQSSPTLTVQPSQLLVPDLDLGQTFSLGGEMEQNTAETKLPPSDEHHSTDPTFFDLQPPDLSPQNVKIEDVMRRLFSEEHLLFILGDYTWLSRFSSFLNKYRIDLVPTLVRYLEMRKALKAVEYANCLAKTIRWPSNTESVKFSRIQASSVDTRFEDYAARELSLLCSEALPLFITNILVGVVSDCVTKDITGRSVPMIQDLVGDLAEVYCLTDPSAPDNPIIYASEEFHRTTQYGTSYAIGRNCRFLQGPATDKNATTRLARAISLGVESNEVLLNYRRDGTPFVNLLMCAPLYDDKGIVRYFIGAQVDITGLILDGIGVESFRSLLQKDSLPDLSQFPLPNQNAPLSSPISISAAATTPKQRRVKETLNKLCELSLMFSTDESEIVTRNSRCNPNTYHYSGRDDANDANDASSIRSTATATVSKSRVAKRIIHADDVDGDLSVSNLQLGDRMGAGNLPGAYKNYLLVRPYPSLQILFVSPSLRLPGLLRTHLFTKLGGSPSTLSALEAAFRDGASVTAKIQWLPKHHGFDARGRERHIRCCPLLGSDDRVGVWMVILAKVEEDSGVGGGLGMNGAGYHSLSSLGMYSRDIAMRREAEVESRGSESGTMRSRKERERERDIKKVIIVNQESEGSLDGGLGLKRAERERLRTPSERELYAEYLRGSTASPALSGRGKRDSRRESKGFDGLQ